MNSLDTSEEVLLHPLPRDVAPGTVTRRDALLGGTLALAGLRAAPTPCDRLVIVDGWVVKLSEVRQT